MSPRLFDVLAIVGLALVAVGLWICHPAAALIAVGAAFITLAFLGARAHQLRAAERRQRRQGSRGPRLYAVDDIGESA